MPLLLASLISCSSSSPDGKTGSKDKNGTSDPVKDGQTAADAAKPIHINEIAFLDKVYDYKTNSNLKYKGDKPCIVDFYADWCGPCRMIAPYMEEFASKYNGKIYVYKVNTDNNQGLAQFFNIESIPAVMFCPMNGQPTMMIGANPKEEYEKSIDKLLLGK